MNSKFFVAGAMMVGQQFGLTLFEVTQFLNGVMFIMVVKDNVNEINTCFKDVDGAVQNVSTAIEDFKIQDASHIVDGIAKLGTVMVNIQKDTTDCTHMHEDMARVAAWAEIFKNPMAALPFIFTNVTSNWVAIIDHLDHLNFNYSLQRWYRMGRYAGLIMVEVLGPLPGTEPYQLQPPTDNDEIMYTQW